LAIHRDPGQRCIYSHQPYFFCENVMPEVPNAPVGKKDKLSVYDMCHRTNVVVIFWMLASRNTPWYLTALRRSMEEICAGSLEASDQSNPSCLTGAMFVWSLSADSYSLRTKSF
jgi:hypothetical protein